MKKQVRCSNCNMNLTFTFPVFEETGVVFCKKCWENESVEEEIIITKECSCVNGCDWCLDIEPRIGRD